MSAAGIPVSVIVPTRDEERNIAECLDSLAWAGEIILFDSHSTDCTVEIARARGARIVQRRFDNFSTHKNWALDNIGFAHPWVLLVDADERATPELAAEIGATIARPDACNGYYVARQNWVWGEPLRCLYPDYNLRLLRHGKGRYEDRIVHEHMVIEGPAGYLRNHLVHRDAKGIERYIDRHNVYSSFEAIEVRRLLDGRNGAQIGANPFRRGPEGRRALKSFAYRYLPARPLFQFLWLYVAKRGFLDGRLGWRYCVLRMFYEYQVSLKLEELNDPESPMSAKYRRYLEP
jgi:glycosyltransferase involved in cell wall biosynthesis